MKCWYRVVRDRKGCSSLGRGRIPFCICHQRRGTRICAQSSWMGRVSYWRITSIFLPRRLPRYGSFCSPGTSRLYVLDSRASSERNVSERNVWISCSHRYRHYGTYSNLGKELGKILYPSAKRC